MCLFLSMHRTHHTGHYVYMNFTGPVPDNPETLLTFPTHRYICHISLSYFTSSSSSLELSVLRFNIGREFAPLSTEPQWNWWDTEFDLSEESSGDYPLKILIEGVGMEGEAEEVGGGGELQVAAVDNITLSFCLPCDFDLLAEPGNLLLSAPSALNISLGRVSNFSLSASSPLCPSLPLIFSIETGEIN